MNFKVLKRNQLNHIAEVRRLRDNRKFKLNQPVLTINGTYPIAEFKEDIQSNDLICILKTSTGISNIYLNELNSL